VRETSIDIKVRKLIIFGLSEKTLTEEYYKEDKKSSYEPHETHLIRQGTLYKNSIKIKLHSFTELIISLLQKKAGIIWMPAFFK
jgi:hypothetical protein